MKISLASLVCGSTLACGGGCADPDTTAPTATIEPAAESLLTVYDPIVISFSESIAPASLSMSGNMAALSDGGAWSTTVFENDTLTISPTTTWDAGSPGALVVDAADLSDNALATLSADFPIHIQLASFPSASVVVGKSTFTSPAAYGPAAANILETVYGPPAFAEDGRMFVSDYGNNRITVYSGVPTANGALADFVLGQASATADLEGQGASEMDGPQAPVIVDGRLLVTEYSNARVLIYNAVPSSGPGVANVLVGQPDFGLAATGCTSTNLEDPQMAGVGGGKLVVTDSGNNRVLIWNAIPTQSGLAADLILGQNSPDTCARNDDDQDGVEDVAPTARTLADPVGVWTDGTRLVVNDSYNNRTLIWNTFPEGNFAPADLVLGQSDFDSKTANDDDQDDTVGPPSARTLNSPGLGVFSNGSQLFIADYANERVLGWNSFPTSNFVPADFVIGQSDFVKVEQNDDNQDGVADVNPSARTFFGPSGVLVRGNQLFVSEAKNHRLLVFEGL